MSTDSANEPLSFESLQWLLRVDRQNDAWTRSQDEELRAHRDAGVELHPLPQRFTHGEPHGLPLHNLLWREMADNLGMGGIWPEVIGWLRTSPGLDQRDHEDLVRLWSGFWVDNNPDPLDTDNMMANGNVEDALAWFDRALQRLGDLGVPHPAEVLPEEWQRVTTLSPVGRLANVAYERQVLRDTVHPADAPAASPLVDPARPGLGRSRL